MQKRIISNNLIRAKQVRLIDQEGKQLGVVGLGEALKKAYAVGLDLIQVTEKLDPPVCKIMNYGKYAYQVGKKEKKGKQARAGEVKSIRLRFAISDHDIETRANAALKFLSQGSKVRIEMVLRGRENALMDFAKLKINKLLEVIKQKTTIRIERELKREARGFAMIIAQEKQHV